MFDIGNEKKMTHNWNDWHKAKKKNYDEEKGDLSLNA